MTESAAEEIHELETKVDTEQERTAEMQATIDKLNKDMQEKTDEMELKHEEELASMRKGYETEID